ncbi:uncharacterized protein LOC110684794 [Chenopodium quinoa]|uniref:uncharacterized protein LOC110684794 n=1 Tax=Chenopodium quinoa TaxID=63459 RepID=UPI000B771A5B|nr:uncharacterized protein LOC110684794 [Chenopodium quinoa]XP_021716917.1 uncharacterized protein LOC110684794 [Chenopodium quinoa]XP_021716918.1 uncharacterized protein LOC110684794 [Chenopodium quinoa]
MVSGKSNVSHRIYHHYGCYDPLQYPLLFPRGESGWNQGLKKRSWGGRQQTAAQVDPVLSCFVHTAEELLDAEASHKCYIPWGAAGKRTRADKYISPREYYAFLLQMRPGNMLLRTGRLLQQYVVDMYVKMESTCLDYFRNNQGTIRSDLYQGILNSLKSGETLASNVGQRVILPPTFIGGPRDMKKRYLNAMTLVKRYEKPDLFITITCNANWQEIKSELALGELPQDRPDLVARVFRAKLLVLKREIMENEVFVEVSAMIYVIEFQKRGLPHGHFLIILKGGSKMKCPEDYDKFVCAEIPPASDPILRKIILRHMMHGPCGHLNPQCPCMRKKGQKPKCKNNFPKKFSPHTTTNKDGFPTYRRRDTGETARVRGATLDNRWVIPYNPYLSVLFDCHINIEVCSTIKAVKYLYKYVYKGHDKVSYNVVPTNG